MSAEHAPITPIREDADVSIEELVARRVSLKADAEYIADEIAQIDAVLVTRLGDGTHRVGEAQVQVREYARTDYAAVERAFPAGQYPQLYVTKTVLDQDAVKRQFAPDALEQFKVRGKKSVLVK